MSQLFAAFGINGSLILAQAVNFALLLIVLRIFLYKPVMQTLEKRRAVVAQGVEDAARAKEKLAGADKAAAMTVEKAEGEADGIVAGAREAASIQKASILKEAEARAEAVERDAQARATETALRAMRDSEKEIARLAILAAEKTMRTS